MAQIQFSKGIDEEVVPDVPHPFAGWQQWHCNVLFPKRLEQQHTEEITGMYMIDEGEIVTREVKGKFVNGKPEALKCLPDEIPR